MNAHAKPTVLIVDDEAPFRKIYRDLFEHEGFHVLEADNGETGLELAREKHPDLILLDQLLPKMHGLEVLKNLRKDKATEPLQVVLLSVMGNAEDVARGLLSGADDYFVKGIFTPKELSAKLHTLFEKK